jgi:prevent-host-death family protein
MSEIGVRELKAHASEIIRAIRDRRVRYVITYRGKPVGLLSPVSEMATLGQLAASESPAVVWDELTRLGEEIGRGWQSPLTGADLLSDMRR